MMPTRFSQLTGRRWPMPVGIATVCLLLGGLAQAAPEASTDFQPKLRLSTYQPTKMRDPFGGKKIDTSTTPVSVASSLFQLQGILYDAKNPTAIVNDQLVELNQPVKVPVKVLDNRSEIEVKAVEMTREKVVMEVGGKRLELWLNSTPDTKSGSQ